MIASRKVAERVEGLVDGYSKGTRLAAYYCPACGKHYTSEAGRICSNGIRRCTCDECFFERSAPVRLTKEQERAIVEMSRSAPFSGFAYASSTISKFKKEGLVASEIVEYEFLGERRTRREYRLTEKGREVARLASAT